MISHNNVYVYGYIHAIKSACYPQYVSTLLRMRVLGAVA